MGLTWIALGIFLIIAEFFLPGGVALFFGSSALLVGLAVLMGGINTWTVAIFTWMALSIVLFLALHKMVRRRLGADREYHYQSDDAESYEKIVLVQNAISLGGEGRIAYQGTTWTARNHHQDRDILPGEQVRLLYREGLIWIVEAVDSAYKR